MGKRLCFTCRWQNGECGGKEGKEEAMYSLNVPAAKAEKYSKGKTDCDLVAFRK